MSTELNQVLDSLKSIQESNTKIENRLTEVEKSSQETRTSFLQGVPFARRGESALTSRGFQFSRVVGVRAKKLDPNFAKVELDLVRRVQDEYVARGFYTKEDASSFCVPLGSELISQSDHGMEKLADEIGQVLKAGVHGADPEEMRYIKRTLGWQDAGSGAELVPPPVFGEPIQLLRNQEVFMKLGCRLIPFPPSGRITWPRFTGATTGYWIGTGASNRSATLSEFTTGDLVLQVKKLGVRCRVPNEMFRFPTVSVEQVLRMDMMKTAALTLDKSLLDSGLGGALEPKALVNYGIQSHTATTVGVNGNTIEPEDILQMVGKVEEKNITFGGWVGRPLLYSHLGNKRADAVTAGDRRGQFLFNMLREFQPNNVDVTNNMVGQLEGYPFMKSNQVSNTVSKGSASNLSYLLGGDFTKYVLALSGVMEIAVSNQGDTNFPEDQTEIRLIMWADGAPEYVEAFIRCNELAYQ